MALLNTINFLPRVFRTATNRRFLGATMDQLFADPANVPVNGFIGRKFAPTYKTGDNYVPELETLRKNYQLEPSVVVVNDNNEIQFNTGYIDLLRNIENYGGLTNNHQRLFGSESYNYDGHYDYDKFVNYFNYYWLPDGPASVDVFGNQAPYTADYAVTRNSAIGGYTFTGTGYQPNTQLTLVRGGTYTFNVDQAGNSFWIQSSPGVTGTDVNVSTISTRDVFGVTNNGEDSGAVTFKVPLRNAQDFYILMPIRASVDAAVTFHYTDIQNRLLSDFLLEFPDGIDGINNQLQNKSFVFIGNDSDASYWTTPSVPAEYTSLDVANIRPGNVIASGTRTNTWKIDLIATDSNNTDYIIQISPMDAVASREKVFISSGKTYASNQFWLNDNLSYIVVPAITANVDRLYYQDSTNGGFVGEIKLIDNVSTPIDVNADIIGKVGYTSPDGVVFTNGLKIQFDSLVTPAEYANTEFYVEGVGTAINLVPVSQTLVPEDFGTYIDTDADYITINRGSQDRNSWSRSNRWFHKDVILATSIYNSTAEDFGPNLPGRRPIVEFEPNLQLFNYGKQAKNSVDLITFTATDAFGVTIPATRVEGQPTAIVDGVTLAPGHRVVFANDYDLNVKNKIWEVTVIAGLGAGNYINLIPANDNPVEAGENVLVTEGTGAGGTYRFDGSNWFTCQTKTALNQMPLFDLVDKDGYSFGDATVYPDSTFVGNKIFNYYPNTTGNNDPILGFPLRYQNFNNIGDIVFKNYYDEDLFTYTSDTTTGKTTDINCGTGYIVSNTGLTVESKLNTWVKGIEPSNQYQLFTKFFDGRVIEINGTNYAFLQIDILPATSQSIPHLKVFKNNALLVNDVDYSLVKYGVYDIIIFNTTPAVGDKLDVAVFSDSVSTLAFYEIPKNLGQNPLNEKFATIALGQVRTHYNKLIENTSISDRPIRDSYLKAQGGTLSQHSAPLVYAMTFLNDPLVNFVNGLDLAKKEYSRFKNKFISLCSSLPNMDYNDPITGVDTILQNINSVKNGNFPWYYSDMVPQGGNYTTLTYTVLNVRQTNYEIASIFDSTQLSNRAVLIWRNGTQLVLGKDYEFSSTVPAVIFSVAFDIDDVIVIRDYFNTDGNFIPETPSKLGLYPKSEPLIYQDTTYQTATNVIRGHDGSLTPAFGDFRDEFLLELEKRIYNNIKADYTKNIINLYDIVPGRFRTTEYSYNEFTQVLSKNFLQWAGTNNVDYTTNEWYDANNPWTWNYEKFTDTVDGSKLQGSWRAVYQHWYDTDQPNLAPWQMLGFGFQPSWWETRYGPAPYTSGNTLLWEDLEAGYVWNNGTPYYNSRFARPDLTKFIPVDSAGNLLPPTDISIIKQYNLTAGANNFVMGQQGPVETAWRRSSDYPFAIQMTLAMCKPASYFGTQYDTSRFYVNPVTAQFTNATNQKITPAGLFINGDARTGTVQRTSGYVNWIADAIKNIGVDPAEKISSYLDNLSVKLNYKVGGFTDKNILTVTAEQTAPGTTRAGVIIPDSNYDVYLSKSVPVTTATYSAVIIQKTTAGYSITGYDTTNPFFGILPSIVNSNAEDVTVEDVTVKLYQDTTQSVTLVPYGTTYASIQQVSDFLTSYERYLRTQGFNFEQFDADLQEVRNFRTGVKEFLFWSQQGWQIGTLIIINPVATQLFLQTNKLVVDEILNMSTSGRVLDQNFLPIKSTNFNILRSENYTNGNIFGLSTLNGASICFAKLNLIQYEHVLVFDNESDFGDVIYVPTQGVRQYRLKLAGSKTGNWTGALSAAGYVYNESKFNEWQPSTDYQVGDIVTFNNNYYTALSSIPASTKFNVSDWAQIQSTDIKTGLLPSFGLNAQQFENIYDIDQPSTDENLQLFSAGLIGFRPRTYLTDLGISIPNQTKFYQGYIREKGSLNSITALTKASFNNVSGAIDIFEEWGFKVGEYGDLDGNQFKEFILDQSVFNTNPVAFTLGNTYSTGNIIVNLKVDANLLLSNVYNSSNLTNVSTQLYSNRNKTLYPEDLPTAGYVHADDTDLSIFDINTYAESPTVGTGSKIWTAKDTDNNWNVYRVSETGTTATTITYVLDDYAQILFDNNHNLEVGDLFVLKGFNIEYFNNSVLENFSTNYDAVYKVTDVVNNLLITVQIRNTDVLNNLIATSPVTSEAIVYKLTSSKIDTVTDIDTITPIDGWINNDRVWVNSATSTNGWGVYTFNKSWPNTGAGELTANTSVSNDSFASYTQISSNAKYFYVNNPGQKQIQVFANTSGTYTSNVTVANATSGFAKTFESQGNLLVVASSANLYIYRHNDSTTANTISMPWVPNAFPTLGTAWTSNTVFSYNSVISYTGNNYVVKGNVYSTAFTDATVTANVIQANLIPVNSIVSYQSNFYITTGNVCPANVLEPQFETISSNTKLLDLAAGNVVLLQTLTLGNLASNVTSVAMSADKQWLYVGGADTVEAYTTTNSNWANVTYTWATSVTGSGAFGNVIKTNNDGSRVFISAPTATNIYTQNGNVYYYTFASNAFTLANTLSSSHKNQGAQFGYSIDIDATAGNLFVGIPGSTNSGFANGLVERWTYNGSGYTRHSEITHPHEESGSFGSTISISSDAKVLAVGSRGSTSEETIMFDTNQTVIDNNSTKFIDSIINSGSVYMFEPLINLANVAEIVYSFTQELETGPTAQLESGDNFGSTIAVNRDLILVGAPGNNSSEGLLYTFANPTQTPAWVQTRAEQQRVDVSSVNRTFIYNKSNNNIIAMLDVIDPSKGKILNSVATDIDYRLNYDPASYNAGTTNVRPDYHWGPQQVGRIWWNLDDVRYTNYEQDALIYRLNHWGDQFPGSQISIYEWVESSVLPSEFAASNNSGIPLHADNSAYSTYGYVDQAGAVRVKYYFWVSNRDQANTRAGKNNSVVAITSAIENPQNQNIPYAVILRDDTVALYNIKSLLVGQNSVLHIGSQSATAGLIHSEYALVQEKSADSELPANIVNKIIDSLAKLDRDGNTVPDPALPASKRYGVDIRPRQTMFVDLDSALINISTIVNAKLYAYPVTQRKVLTLLNSEEAAPGPRTGQWDIQVDTNTELTYVTTTGLSAGYKVLVVSDPTYLGKWSIYEWTGTTWTIPADGTRPLGNGQYGNWVQSYKTNLYWSYVDWYDASFDPSTVVDITVADNLEFGKLTLTADTYIKVLNAGNDKFAIYYINSALERVTVGLESGTIQLPTTMSTIPGKELRQILLSVQNEIFIDDLAQDFNEIFFAMIKFALTEQKNIDWAFKTSFISATQYIRKLEQFPSYISDNQDFYQNYINEVKPYRTILREFNINYQRDDEFGGDITDFDLAPYWDSNINVYRSPSGEQSYDNELLNNRVYYDWKNNYAYKVVDIVVGKPGTGFITAPQIIISGGGGSGANAVAQIDAYGTLSNVTIVNPGSGYTSNPTIVINGTGTGAVATPVLRNVYDQNDSGHNVVRSVKTSLKFDRINYTNPNTFVFWNEITSANVGQTIPADTIVVLDNVLYKMITANTISPSIEFPSANVSQISVTDFNNANDRIVAYNGNIDLSATAEGIDYPGVVVDGSNYFAYDTATVWTPNTSIVAGTQITYAGNVYIVNGNVAAPYFANITSNVTQVNGIKIDSIIQSRYSDNLGIDSGNIYVDGGEYVDRFSSHAPEELIPGHMFDSVNIQVFSNVAPDTNDYAFRLFDNMTQDHTFYRISNASTTTLSRDLLITDDKIFVADASRLPSPNRVDGIPGMVFINGEKIHYYRNYGLELVTAWASNTVIADDTLTSFDGNIYLTLGNVFAQNIPWTPNTVFASNSYVYYSGNSYQITGNVNAPYFANIVANTALLYNNEDSGFASVSSNVALIGNTVNAIGQIRRAVDGTAPNSLNVTPWTTNTAFAQGSYVSYLGNTYTTVGNVYGGDVVWKANITLSANSYFSYGANVYQVTGNVYVPRTGSFANIVANTALVYLGRTDSGFASIESNLGLLYSGTTNLRHLANAHVVDASLTQAIPDVNVYSGNIIASTPTNVTSNVSVKLRVSANITANIGDYITTAVANVRVLETVTAKSNVAVTGISGNIFVATGNAVNVVNRITGNSTATSANVLYANILGTVDGVGNVTFASNIVVTHSNIWYGNVTDYFYGDTLLNSTTTEAGFLKASPGYIP